MGIKSIVILDSCVWVALFHENDVHHKAAEAIFSTIDSPVIVPEYVLMEVTNALVRKAGKARANDFIQFLSKSESFFLQHIDSAELEILMHFFTNSPHEKLSFVDHHLLMLSKNHKVLTFDEKLKGELFEA
jgi:predicted nucleic acid-binding protein